jgi:hypothetical protein
LHGASVVKPLLGLEGSVRNMGRASSATAVVRLSQLKDTMWPNETNWGLDSVCLIVRVPLEPVSSDDSLFRP